MTDRQTDRQTDKVKTNRLTTQSIISGMNIGLKHLSRYPVKECLTLPPTCSSHPVALCSSQCMSPRYIFIGHMAFYESPLSVTEFTRSRYATLFGFTTTNTMFYNITDAFRLLSSCARSTLVPHELLCLNTILYGISLTILDYFSKRTFLRNHRDKTNTTFISKNSRIRVLQSPFPMWSTFTYRMAFF